MHACTKPLEAPSICGLFETSTVSVWKKTKICICVYAFMYKGPSVWGRHAYVCVYLCMKALGTTYTYIDTYAHFSLFLRTLSCPRRISGNNNYRVVFERVADIDIDRIPFLPWDCLLPICSTCTKHSTQDVLQPLNKVARVKYWILPSVCDSALWSFLFFESILISILTDHYPVSPLGQTPLNLLTPSQATWGKYNLPLQCFKI